MNEGVPERLASIESRIAAACLRAHRDPVEVTLLGAAKRQSDERLVAACRAGLRNFGENIVQEAEAHRRLLADVEPTRRLTGHLTWHLIGPLQSNKVRKAVEIFDCVHSIDRLKIARRLDLEARKANRKLTGFLEVNLGAEPTKHGFAPEELPLIMAEVTSLDHLSITGLMAIPPVSNTDADARGWFRRLRELRDHFFQDSGSLSMGMSADFEIAIEEGATHVRVGSALFGPRSPRSSRPS